MTKLHKKRMIMIALVVCAVAISVAMATTALKQNINLFFTPEQITHGEVKVGQKIRIGGMVVKGSVQRDPNTLNVQFIVTDYKANVVVNYNGILPDLFKEGQGVVATGQLQRNQQFIATEVLAKHDENYMPPQVKAVLNHNEKKNDS
jgi:cytochrome c-type biogenesis protein CcmE